MPLLINNPYLQSDGCSVRESLSLFYLFFLILLSLQPLTFNLTNLYNQFYAVEFAITPVGELIQDGCSTVKMLSDLGYKKKTLKLYKKTHNTTIFHIVL